MHQHQPLRSGLDQMKEQLVGGGRLDGDEKRLILLEKGLDLLRIGARKRRTSDDFTSTTGFNHDANADSLLVEVDADVVHGKAPAVETGDIRHHRFTTSCRPRRATRPDLRLFIASPYFRQ